VYLVRTDRRGRVPSVSAVGASCTDGSCPRLGSSRLGRLSGPPLPCSGSTPTTAGIGGLSCDAQSCRRFLRYFLPLTSTSYDLLPKILVHLSSVHFVAFGNFIWMAWPCFNG
jgi:hypothetical protein